MKIKNNIVEIMIAAGVLLLIFYSSDPSIRGDSLRYLHTNSIDPPMYSSIIAIMLSLFGTLKSVIILQTILIGLGIVYFSNIMTIIFNLDQIKKIIVSLFLFVPIIQYYDYLLTEPLGYAFSLLLVGSTIKLIFNFNNRNLFWNTFFVIVLLLLRKQFIFLYPVILLLYLGIFILTKSKKTFVWLTISFLAIVTISNSLIFLDKYVNQDPFDDKSTPSSNETKYGPLYFIYIDSIYISTVKDAKLFENQNEQETIVKIFNEMNNQKALKKYYNGRGHYGLSFNNIRIYADPLLENLASQENTTVFNLQKKICIILIKANFIKYIKHIFKKFYDSTWLFIFVPFLILLAAIINFPKCKSNLLLFTIFLSTFALANHSMIYIFGRVQPRYFIYTDFILLLFIFLFFANFLKKNR